MELYLEPSVIGLLPKIGECGSPPSEVPPLREAQAREEEKWERPPLSGRLHRPLNGPDDVRQGHRVSN